MIDPTADPIDGSATPRVLQVAGSMNRGGAETMLMNVFRALDRTKLQFDFLEFGETRSHYSAEIEQLGGRIIRMRPPADLGPARALREYSALMRDNGPYIAVHGHLLHGSALPLLAARHEGIPIRIAHSHNTADRRGPIVHAYQRLARIALRASATDLRACGPEAATYLFGARPSKPVRTIHNGIDAASFAPRTGSEVDALRRRLEGSPGDILVGSIARLEPVKNHHFLVRLAEELRATGVPTTFVFVGDGSLRRTLEESVVQRGLADVVHFLGVRTDIPEILNVLDLVVLPSHHEGVPVSLIEAQAAGVPSIVSTSVSHAVDLGLGLIDFLDVESSVEWVRAIALRGRLEASIRAAAAEASRAALRAQGYDIRDVVKDLMTGYRVNHA